MAEAIAPWYPASKGPKPDTQVVLIAEEFPNSRLPFWGYNVNLVLVAPPAATLVRLVEGVRSSNQFANKRSACEKRLSQIRERHESQENALHDDAEQYATHVPIDPRWACQALARAIPEDAIVVEETTVHRTLIQTMIRRTRPMSYIGRVTGGLGVGLSYALGAKLAMREKPVVALLGDGAFHYNPVAACLGLSQEYELPIVVILFNNQRYLSMERGLLKYFPNGAGKRAGLHYGAPISPNPDYQLFAQIYGGHGVKILEPQAAQPAIEEALKHAANGRLALVDIVLNDYSSR